MASIKQQYDAQGFYLNVAQRLPAELIRRSTAGMMAIRRGEYDTGRPPEESGWNPGDSEDVLCKIEQPQFASRAVLELVSHPLLGQIAAEATGAQWVQVWWVQLLFKPPSRQATAGGTNIGWHQDRNYWQRWEEGSELFTAWVALSDVTIEAGPMIFVRGSHRWGFLPGSDFHGQDLQQIKSSISVPPGENWEEIPAVLPPGGFSLHDDLTWHGSGANLSHSPRMAFAIHMRTEKSLPIGDAREGLTKYIDDTAVCPIIFNGQTRSAAP
ncbi:MAG: phytanoyl-CoA dioxygenase family protein [Candidatus Sumerlaeaceae bacterium]